MQIAVKIHKRLKGVKITRALAREWVLNKARTATETYAGDTPRGVELIIQRWRNPGRRTSGGRDWRSGNQTDAWTTLRGPLQFARLVF